jgi:hypothetical protein
MEDQVIPITICNIAWQQYLSMISDWLGHPPSRGIDSSSSKLSPIAKYTASLAEFEAGQELDPKRTLREQGPWLRHTFFSFLILTSESTILKVAEITDLDILSVQSEDGRAAVISGTLDAWRTAVILCCRSTMTRRTRLLFNVIKQTFDHIGLSDLWFEYRATKHQDQTFLLEYKSN